MTLANCQQWEEFIFAEGEPIYEIFNEEYINAFADYFVGKIEEHGASEDQPLVILEIGAGNGRLHHFLQQKLEEKAPRKTKVFATDSGTMALKNDFPVEQLTHDEALKKYSPDIVIFSWMPFGVDCTKDIRQFDSVKEYILIGEADGGCCGDPWETWGRNLSYNQGNNKKPPYEADQFKKEYLDDLSKLQINRNFGSPGCSVCSMTVSFKRMAGWDLFFRNYDI